MLVTLDRANVTGSLHSALLLHVFFLVPSQRLGGIMNIVSPS